MPFNGAAGREVIVGRHFTTLELQFEFGFRQRFELLRLVKLALLGGELPALVARLLCRFDGLREGFLQKCAVLAFYLKFRIAFERFLDSADFDGLSESTRSRNA